MISLPSFVALLSATPLVSSRSLPRRGLNFIPRQATPGFSGCQYPEGWVNCNSVENRGCWVRSPNGTEYNINTDYDDETKAPPGIERPYDLVLTEESISPDGTPKPLAKLINGKYPGEIVEACWGDTLVVNVKNTLPTNGSTIHWHGVRQLGTNEMDGVNGVTQCPIADQDTYQYKFKVYQYGVSWYHSHYSSQYSDGVAAPLLFHGPTSPITPSSEDWTDELEPIIVTDWLHKSAFEEFHKEIAGGALPQADSILVNGKGRYGTGGEYFKQKFEAGKRYLVRIINGSTGFHFHFSLDNHKMKVIGTDFVSIEPYETESLSVGIGQRYTVIIEAKPDTESANGKYFLRTEYNTTNGCNQELTGAGITAMMDQSGIIYYGDDSDALPETTRHDLPVGCADEPYDKLKPIVPWTVSEPQNNVADDTFEAGLDTTNANKWHNAVFRWSITDTPLWLNFSDPLILNLDNQTFNPEYAVVGENFKDGEKYVYLVIQAGNLQTNPGPVTKFGAAHHPIHLHGHDFAVIGQSTQPWDPANPGFKLDNPPRRDVAMLPASGHLAIAFKTDNPGAWILHCHIAWHAGSGLALNILERQDEIVIGTKEKVEEGCTGWNNWLAGHKDVFDPLEDQEDSGI